MTTSSATSAAAQGHYGPTTTAAPMPSVELVLGAERRNVVHEAVSHADRAAHLARIRRRAYVGRAVEAVVSAEKRLAGALLLDDAAQAATALAVADELERTAGALRQGAEAVGPEPEPRPSTRTLSGEAASFGGGKST